MPTHPKILADKAMAQMRAGQFNAAFKTARGAAKEHPNESFFPNLCGLALVQGGEPRDAVDWFRKALRLMPGNVDAQTNLIQTYVSLGESDRALDLISKVISKRSDLNVVLYLKAMALNSAGRLADAKATLDDLIAAYPTEARAWNLRGTIRYGLGEEHAALADHEQALRLKPDAPDVLVNAALLHARAGRMADALAATDQALRLAPDYQIALHRRMTFLNEMGDAAGALDMAQRILQRSPDHAEVMLDAADIVAPDEAAALSAQVGAALARSRPATLDRAYLVLAQAKLAMKSGDRTGAMRLFAEGNALHAGLRPFDVARTEAEVAATLALFPPGYVAPTGLAHAVPRAVFVLGLPRSGTTLTEQVLSAHPLVHGAGELPWMERAARRALQAGQPFDADAARALAAYYRQGLPAMAPDVQAVVDKMPGNYKRIGFILAAMPDAVVISVRRDPRDVGLSMWQTTFGSEGMAFSYDQRLIARELNEYARVMRHWHALFPDRIHDLHYAALVSDIDGESRRLAAICGLDWVPDMARPHENRREVRTASVRQVRQPVSARSVGGWRQHADALSVMIAGLDPDLWPDLAD